MSQKEIVIVYSGGFKDGERYSTRSKNSAAVQTAGGQYMMTNQGELGRRQWNVTYKGRNIIETTTWTDENGDVHGEPIPDCEIHFYDVADKFEDDDQIRVTLKFIGTGEQYNGDGQPKRPQ